MSALTLDMPGLHRWMSKVDHEPPADSPLEDLFITMVKETVKSTFEKMKRVKLDKNAIDGEIACDCVKRAYVVFGLRAEIFARTHMYTATHKPTSAQRLNPIPTSKLCPLRRYTSSHTLLKAGPLEAILVIFGRSFLNVFVSNVLKICKMTPLLCACAVVITLETQKCRKRHSLCRI